MLGIIVGFTPLVGFDAYPTRRSSDLPRPVCMFPGRFDHRDMRIIIGYFRTFFMQIIHEFIGGGLMDYLQDRKSTRLNSSHVAISYAVFGSKQQLAASDTNVRISRLAY